MAKRSTSPKLNLSGAKAFAPDTVHTLELPELFERLKFGASHFSIDAVTFVTYDWNGNMSWSQALDAAQYGKWEAPAIDSLTLPSLETPSDDMRYSYDVTGQALDIAAFCAGEPEHWQVAEPIYKPATRVFRFAVEIGGMGTIAADSLRNRGEAIIALINSLELQGHSCEVTIVRAFSNARGESYKFLIPIKAAGQALDVKRFQFIIGHPAFFRRCLFGLSEMAQGTNMGTCHTSTQNYKPEGFTHIPYQDGLGSKEDAIEWAKQFALSLNSNQN
jgi:hypothetical protein